MNYNFFSPIIQLCLGLIFLPNLIFGQTTITIGENSNEPTVVLSPKNSSNQIIAAANVDRIFYLEKGATNFVCLNFANPDMVGHTGDYNAIKKAVETVDNCTRKVVEEGLKNDYAFIIIADHGNADFAINEDGSPNTAHSTNLVPCFALNTGFEKIENGKLGDIAPTILKIMGVEIPTEMTGEILIK